MSILHRDASKAELRAAVAELEAKLADMTGQRTRAARDALVAEARIEAVRAVIDEHSEGEFSGACDICEWLDKVATALAAVPPETPKETT